MCAKPTINIICPHIAVRVKLRSSQYLSRYTGCKGGVSRSVKACITLQMSFFGVLSNLGKIRKKSQHLVKKWNSRAIRAWSVPKWYQHHILIYTVHLHRWIVRYSTYCSCSTRLRLVGWNTFGPKNGRKWTFFHTNFEFRRIEVQNWPHNA